MYPQKKEEHQRRSKYAVLYSVEMDNIATKTMGKNKRNKNIKSYREENKLMKIDNG